MPSEPALRVPLFEHAPWVFAFSIYRRRGFFDWIIVDVGYAFYA
jgi:hypothetical protein